MPERQEQRPRRGVVAGAVAGAGHGATPSPMRQAILRVRAVLGQEGFKNFRFVSRRFQTGQMTAREYYDAVQKTLPAQHLDTLAPPLFALLPNEKQRHELLQLHRAAKASGSAAPVTANPRIRSPSSVEESSPYQHPKHVSNSKESLAHMLQEEVHLTATRLVLLATQNDAAATRSLLTLGVSPNDSNSLGQSALHVAAKHLHGEVMVALLEYGADVNSINRVTGSTPLHCVAQSIDWTDSEKHTPVADCAAMLLERGADPQRVDRFGRCANDYAIDRWGEAKAQQWFGELSVFDVAKVEALDVGNGAEACTGAEGSGRTTLHAFVREGCGELELEDKLEELFGSRGADGAPSGSIRSKEEERVILNAVDEKGNTALHVAVERGTAEAVSLLLRCGASPSTFNHLGTTPLHSSVSRGKLPIVRLLLEAGADACARERPQGSTVVRKSADGANEAEGDGTTPLHLAAEEGDHEAIKLLISFGADATADAKDGEGMTALEIARENDYEESVAVLSSGSGS